jgi:CubicO group peptidase (beta-lactamase class C family)
MSFLTDVLANEPPNRATGDAAYSNVGYTAAALMMEKVTGKSWELLIVAEIFRPLFLMPAAFGWPATKTTPHQPYGHTRRGGRQIPQPLDDSYMLPVALWPAGAVNMSIGALASYAEDHLRGLRGERALLTDSSYARIHRTLSGEPSGYTLGWGVRADPRWGSVHYGAGSGGTFFVRIMIVPQANVAIVVAANSGDAGAATREVVETILNNL